MEADADAGHSLAGRPLIGRWRGYWTSWIPIVSDGSNGP
jgi:hypothetical protein